MTKNAVDPCLVVAAPLAIEARALRRGAPLSVMRTGAGRRRAAEGARRLAEEPAATVAVAGLCGALTPGLAPGDVVLASELRAADREPLRLHPEPLSRILEDAGVPFCVGPIVGSERVVHGAARSRLAEGGALAVDMESAWLAPGAAGRPLAVLRVVLDGPGHELLRPELPRQLFRALRRLRALAPELQRWAYETCECPPRASTPLVQLVQEV